MGKHLKENEGGCRDSGFGVGVGVKYTGLGSLDSILDSLDNVIDEVLQNAPPRVCSN